MSSILDALNKLEDRKKKAEMKNPPLKVSFRREPVQEERPQPVPQPVGGDHRLTVRVTPMTVIVCAIVLGVFQIAASVGASILIAGSSAGWFNVFQRPAQVSPAPIADEPVIAAPPAAATPSPVPEIAKVEVAGVSPAPAPKAMAVKSATAPAPAPTPSPAAALPKLDLVAKADTTSAKIVPPVVKSEPLPPTPTPVQTVKAAPTPPPAPETVAPTAGRKEAASTTVEPVDVNSLPALTESDKAKFGLTKMQVNLPRPAGRGRPVASAIINLQTVHVGELIPNTPAMLLEVDMRGIAVEIRGTGERFRIGF